MISKFEKQLIISWQLFFFVHSSRAIPHYGNQNKTKCVVCFPCCCVESPVVGRVFQLFLSVDQC